MSYTQVWDHMKNQPHDSIIQRDEDGAFIPFDDANMDYVEYKKWIGKGNQPKGCEAPPVQQEEPVQTQKTAPKF
jgi:hypothetical protein